MTIRIRNHYFIHEKTPPPTLQSHLQALSRPRLGCTNLYGGTTANTATAQYASSRLSNAIMAKILTYLSNVPRFMSRQNSKTPNAGKVDKPETGNTKAACGLTQIGRASCRDSVSLAGG